MDYEQKLRELKYEIYQRYIKTISDEQLRQEYCDRGLSVSHEMESISVGNMINRLEDFMSNVLFDDPNYTPFNIEEITFKKGE